ncbi:hypothetical protein DVH05_027934 [Phytophthora capsici]|nr:hypothetical protein DVH05_027934 [Phytophthora capsici]
MLRRTCTDKPLMGSPILRSLSLSALTTSAISVGVGAVALYVDAPLADLGDGNYNASQRPEVFAEWIHDLARVPIFGAATLASKFYLQILNRTAVEGVENLRPKGTAIITVSNHSATVDDPAVFATMTPRNYALPWNGSLSLASQEYCYAKGKLLSTVFFGAKTLPVKRGLELTIREDFILLPPLVKKLLAHS